VRKHLPEQLYLKFKDIDLPTKPENLIAHFSWPICLACAGRLIELVKPIQAILPEVTPPERGRVRARLLQSMGWLYLCRFAVLLMSLQR
jgi:hypothetical protein